MLQLYIVTVVIMRLRACIEITVHATLIAFLFLNITDWHIMMHFINKLYFPLFYLMKSCYYRGYLMELR